jgi:hypothetical protein
MRGIKGLLRRYQDGGPPHDACTEQYGPGWVTDPNTNQCVQANPCSDPSKPYWNPDTRTCEGIPRPPCRRGMIWDDATRTCVRSGDSNGGCGEGQELRNGQCVPIGSSGCQENEQLVDGQCVPISGDIPCASGFEKNDLGTCVKIGSSDTGDTGDTGGGTMPVGWRTSASNIPGLSPYYADLASSLYRTGMEGYTPYGGQEIAGFSPFETQAMRGIGAYARGPGPSGMTAAGQAFGAAGYGMGEMAGGAGDVGTFAGMAPGAFADTYMSPYQRAVTDIQTRQAREQGQKALAEVGSQAAQARAFGGGRHGVQESEVRGQTAQQVADIEARGAQDAWTAGMQARGMDVSTQAANRQRQLDALRAQGYTASQMGQYGANQQRLFFERMMGLGEQGEKARGLNQAALDLARKRFEEQRDWPKEQQTWMADMYGAMAPYMEVQKSEREFKPQGSDFSSLLSGGIGMVSNYQQYLNQQEYLRWLRSQQGIKCRPGYTDDGTGQCVPESTTGTPCDRGEAGWVLIDGECVQEQAEETPCDRGEAGWVLIDGECVEEISDPVCYDGQGNVVDRLPNGDCPPITDPPPPCPQGMAPDANGDCQPIIVTPPQCDQGWHWDDVTEQCVRDTSDPVDCDDGYHWDEATQQCVRDPQPPLDCDLGYIWDPATRECVELPPCGPGQTRDENNNCVTTPIQCNPGQELINGVCVDVQIPCGPGQERDANGNCVNVPVTPGTCPDGVTPVPPEGLGGCPPQPPPLDLCTEEHGPGWVTDPTTGQCKEVVNPPIVCGDGQELINGVCVDVQIPCKAGYQKDANGDCVPIPVVCTGGKQKDLSGNCVCPPGMEEDQFGQCISTPVTPTLCPDGSQRPPFGDCKCSDGSLMSDTAPYCAEVGPPGPPTPPTPSTPPPCSDGQPRDIYGNCPQPPPFVPGGGGGGNTTPPGSSGGGGGNTTPPGSSGGGGGAPPGGGGGGPPMFRHGGPLVGYDNGGWPPWKKPVLPYQDLPYEGIGSSASKVSRPPSLWKHAKRGGLPMLIAMELMFPKKAGAGEDDKLERMRAQAAYQKMMDKQHGEGWSSDPVESPRINPPVDPSRVIE